MKQQVRVQEREGEQHTCPLCRDDLDDDPHACLGCETRYHTACLAELGGCSTLGCRLRGKLPDALPSWFCRACHQPIESDLTRRNCRCGAYLHDACVEAHAERCAQGAELRRDPSRPAAPRGAPPASLIDPSSGGLTPRAILIGLSAAFTLLLLIVAAAWTTQSKALEEQRRRRVFVQRQDDYAAWKLDALLAVLPSQPDDATSPAYQELLGRADLRRFDLLPHAARDARVRRVLEAGTGQSLLEVALDACAQPDRDVRLDGLYALSHLPATPESRAALERAQQSEDRIVRRAAARSLRILETSGLPGGAEAGP